MAVIPFVNFIIFAFSISCNIIWAGASCDDAYSRVVEANTNLTAEFVYHLFRKTSPQLSSISVYPLLQPLSVLAMHSECTTYNQLQKILNLNNKNEICNVFKKVTKMLTTTGADDVKFDLSLNVFGNLSSPFDPCFVRDVQNCINGQTRNVDFSKPSQTAAYINSLIKKVVPSNYFVNSTTPISPNLICSMKNNSLLFTSAYNLTYNWVYPFNPKYTRNHDYDTGTGQILQIPFMYRVGHYKYANLTDLKAQALEIPIKGGRFGFLLVIPYQASHAPELAEKLRDPKVFKSINDRKKSHYLQIYLIKGQLAENVDLIKNLREISNDKLNLDNIKGVFASGQNPHVAGIFESLQATLEEGHGDIDYDMESNCNVPVVKVDKTSIYCLLNIEDGRSDPIISGLTMNLSNVPVQ